MMDYQIAKNQKTNKPAYQRPITVLFLLQLLLLVKFSLFCVVVVFFGGVIGCGEDDQLVLLFSVFIYSSFTSFELSRISLSVSLDSLLYYLFLRQSSITVHVQRSTNPSVHYFLTHFALSGRLRPKHY